MKTYFKDGKDWQVVVWGDWRDKKGKTIKYQDSAMNKIILITGGMGFYYFFRGKFEEAIKSYLEDLEAIKTVEKEEKRRFHKGLFYYQISISYVNLKDKKMADKYMKLAAQEDKITYGIKAKDFPASKAVIEE